MADERRGAHAGSDEGLKVVDRRRFTPEGEPIESEGAPQAHAAASAEGSREGEAAARRAEEAGERAAEGEVVNPASGDSVDPRDARITEQAARIDQLTRAYAALVEDNRAFRQRLEREKTRVVDAERASVAQALLEAADDLERALAAVSGAVEEHGREMRSLVEGVRLSLAALQKRIAELGAQRIPVAGARFDPHVAEAIDIVAVADAEQDGVVLQEIRPGYRIGDRVLRPARVRVGRLARA